MTTVAGDNVCRQSRQASGSFCAQSEWRGAERPFPPRLLRLRLFHSRLRATFTIHSCPDVGWLPPYNVLINIEYLEIILGLDLSCRRRFATLRASDSQGASMNRGKSIFAQITEHLPLTTFRRCVARFKTRIFCTD